MDPKVSMLELIDRYISSEYEDETGNRNSLEVRAIALVSLNLGVVTLYFALRDQIGIWQPPVTGVTQFMLIAATALSLVSVVLAAIAVLPARVLMSNETNVRELVAAIVAGTEDPEEIAAEILDARIRGLKSRARVNSVKAGFVIASFWFFVGVAIAFISAVAIASYFPGLGA